MSERSMFGRVLRSVAGLFGWAYLIDVRDESGFAFVGPVWTVRLVKWWLRRRGVAIHFEVAPHESGLCWESRNCQRCAQFA